jgi:hypothetical protein
MTTSKKIAIIGTGNVGAAIGTHLARSGHAVVFGTRRPGEVTDLLGKAGPSATAKLPAEAAAEADVILLAVPAAAAVDAAKSLGDLSGKILVDCNNSLRWDKGPVWSPPPEGSLTAAIASAVPSAKVVKAWNTFGAEFHGDPKTADGPADLFMAGDDAEAKAVVGQIAESAGYRPVDSGPLRNAAVLENLAILWIHLATVGGHGRNFAFRMAPR